MRALIACHAGVGVGLGHLSRSLVVARALHARFGASVRLLIQGDRPERKELGIWPHRWVEWNQDLVAQLCAEDQPDLVLLDLQQQRVPSHLGQAIAHFHDMAAKVVAIDGLLPWRPDLDLIFLPTFQFKPPADLEDGAPIVFGWDCFLIDSDLLPTPWTAGSRALALTGGSDATFLGQTWPCRLDQTLPEHVELHWVTGPFSRPPVWPTSPRIRTIEYLAPRSLGAIMRQVQYAVTVFGVSFFELLKLGVPTVVFSPYGGKDDYELAALREAGVALVAANDREATDLLTDLIRTEKLARQLSETAQATLNVCGSKRLCSEISRLFSF